MDAIGTYVWHVMCTRANPVPTMHITHVVTSLVSWCHACDSNGEIGKLKSDRHTCTRWHAHIHGGWEYVSSTEHRKAMQMTCNGHASAKTMETMPCQELPRTAKNKPSNSKKSRANPWQGMPITAKKCIGKAKERSVPTMHTTHVVTSLVSWCHVSHRVTAMVESAS